MPIAQIENAGRPPAEGTRRERTSRVIDLDAISEADLDSWRALADEAVEPNPFFEPDLVLPAIAHLDGARAQLLVIEDGDGWLACMPIGSDRLRRVFAIRPSNFYVHCFCGTPLLRRDQPDEAAEALLRFALGQGRAPLLLADLVDDGPAGEAMRHAIAATGAATLREHREQRALLLRRPDGGYLDHMKSHRRRELNRLGRRLEGELGGTITVEDHAGDPDARSTFLRLEGSGWKGDMGTDMGADHGGAFFTEVCDRLAERGQLELLELAVGDRPVAMKCTIYSGAGGFCFKIAHDAELGSFSPGVQLERLNVDRFDSDRHEAWQDSCANPGNEMINRLWPDRRTIRTVLLLPRGARASILTRAIALADARKARREHSDAATA